MTEPKPDNMIAFQGEQGAYSHLACKKAYPLMEALPCPTFEDAFAAVEEGQAKLAMIPIENSLAGRVADIHQILPHSGLHIIAEHFLRVRHQLLGVKDASLKTVKVALSHVQALGQCRNHLREMGIRAQTYPDTAGAAKHVAELNDPAIGAVASALAGEIYGLKILKPDIEDADHNTTRFIVMSREEVLPEAKEPAMMAFMFQVRNVPAALYKAMGGFATNGVNMTKLESYQLGGKFTATQFYAEIEGHPSQRKVQLAMEELKFFTSTIRILGTFPKAKNREDFH
jgi:prephenate dehydratase